MRRDIAVVVDENIAVADTLEALTRLQQPNVERFDVFDVYRGHELPTRQEKRCDSCGYAGY